MDAFTAATWTSQRARATCVRDRSAPVVMPRDLVGHMPDPRTPPAWMQRQAVVPDFDEPILPRGWIWTALVAMAGAAVTVAALVML